MPGLVEAAAKIGLAKEKTRAKMARVEFVNCIVKDDRVFIQELTNCFGELAGVENVFKAGFLRAGKPVEYPLAFSWNQAILYLECCLQSVGWGYMQMRLKRREDYSRGFIMMKP